MKNITSILVFVGIILLIFNVAFFERLYITDESVEITVMSKERVNKGTDSYYLVSVEYDDGTRDMVKNTDTLQFFKFDSSILQSKLDVGSTYLVTLSGWRSGLFSSYRNIIRIEE